MPTSDSQDNNDSDESPSTDTTTLSSSVYTRSDNCDRDNVDVATAQATLLIGGAEQNATGEIAATQWLLDNATGGDYLVIRSDGIGSQANWVCDNFSASINSAAELNLTSQTLANDDRVVKIIEDADIIFFAGGDQSAYRSAWRGTKANTALNTHLSLGKPIAGTSAGMAILGGAYYAPSTSGVLSSEILDDPFNSFTSEITNGDFLLHPQLTNIITDTHLDRSHGSNNETRYGRIFGFLARLVAMTNISQAKAIAAEEATFVAIDENQLVTVFGEGSAYFLKPLATPETLADAQALVWNNSQQAVEVHKINASVDANFDLSTWSITGETPEYWYSSDGYTGFSCNGCITEN